MSKFRFRHKVKTIEYEDLQHICFACGKFGHRKDTCLDFAKPVHSENIVDTMYKVMVDSNVDEAVRSGMVEKFDPWMVAKSGMRRNPRKSTVIQDKKGNVLAKKISISH